MRRSPSIVPLGNDQEIYLVLDDFGALGSAWREANVEDTDLETVIADLLDGWSRDVSEDVARELRQRCADQDRELPEFLHEFVERYVGPNEGVRFPLPILCRSEPG